MKSFISKLFPLVAVLLVLFIPRWAFSGGVSTTGEQFLTIPAGVRGASMGDAFTAVADDVSTTYWNMAGLAQLDRIELNFLYVNYFASTTYGFAGAALPLGPGSTLGLSASFDFVPSFNSTNNPAATPGSAGDLALSLGYGQRFGDHFALGIGGKYISSALAGSTASGEAVDAGLLLFTKDRDWTLGLAVQNVGQVSSFSQYSTQEKLPLDYRAGLAYRFQPRQPTRFTLAVDAEKPVDGDVLVHTGGEVWLGGKTFSVAFRAGYSFDPLNQDLGGGVGATYGAGVRWDGLELDYALVPFGVLGDTHRFSIGYRFGGGGGPAPEAERKARPSAVQIQPEIADFKTGTLKQATFDLKPRARTDIRNWSLDITDPQGNVIRTYSGKGVPPKQIAWDGKDSRGNVVAGGIFATYSFRTVDSRGQQAVASEPIFKVSRLSGREAPLAAALSAEVAAPSAAALPEHLKPSGPLGAIKLPGITFAEGSARLTPSDSRYLDEVARVIGRHPDSRVYLEGHACDEGPERQELALSQNRADAVLRYLVEKEKVSPDNLYSRGHGDSAPLDTRDTEEARLKNRRVDIVILTKGE